MANDETEPTPQILYSTNVSAMPSGAIGSIPPARVYALTEALPSEYFLRIGKIMVRWSIEEWLLQQMLFNLSSESLPVARVTVGFPRAEQAIERIEQVLLARSITVMTDTGKLKIEVKRLEKTRDLVGHGIWIRNDVQKLCVVEYAGNWGPGFPDLSGTPRRLTPHAKPIDEAFLDKAYEDIGAAIKVTETLRAEVDTALAALRGRSNE